MFRTIVAACGAAALAGLTVAAQTPPPKTPSAKFDTPATVTYTGCLAPDDKKSGSGAGEGAAGVERYLLTNAMQAGKTATEDEKPAPAGAAKGQDTLTLIAGPGVKLAPHLNHKVDVTGTLQSAGSAMGKSTPETGTPSPSAAMKAKALTVTAVKMVSATCP